MALTDPKDTLAYHMSRPLTVHRPMADVPCSAVASSIQAFMNADKKANTLPEKEALWFYGLNHGVALISQHRHPLEKLPDDELEFVQFYHEFMGEKAVRAFYYLLMICIRESRHNQSLGKLKNMESTFGKEIVDFYLSISGGESSISSAFLKHPPNGPIGKFVEAVTWQFYKCSWHGGYGGKKWGVVSDCLTRFVLGEFTAEMMLDTNWTLAHNGGPIFNKGLFYGHYGAQLGKLLDVQRSGQIPHAILEGLFHEFLEQPMIDRMGYLREKFPTKVGDYVDWYLVEELGSIGKYPKEKAQQAENKMTPEEKAAMKEKAKLAAQLKAEQAAAVLAAKYDNQIQIMPGVWIPKIKSDRKEAA